MLDRKEHKRTQWKPNRPEKDVLAERKDFLSYIQTQLFKKKTTKFGHSNTSETSLRNGAQLPFFVNKFVTGRVLILSKLPLKVLLN